MSKERFDIDEVIRILGLEIRAEQADEGRDFDVACRIALNKLEKCKQYEDLEEQGLLLRLPVKIRQTLYTNQRMQGWYFRMKDTPYRVEVAFIGLNNDDDMGGGFFNVCYENHGHMLQFNFSDIGKTVFLTQSEAEEKLRELEGK